MHNHSHVTDHIHYFDFNTADLILTDDQLIQYALADIEMMLRSCVKSLKDYPPMPRADTSLVPDIQNSLILDELNYNKAT